MAKREDHTKLGNLIMDMAKQTGHVPNAEDCAKMHQALNICEQQMQNNEDPNGTICCNEGHTHLSCEVDIWGTCPDMQ